MSRSARIEQTYEVRVRDNGQIRMLHFDAHTHHQAMCRAQETGFFIISVRKVNLDKMIGNIEKLDLGNVEHIEGEYHPAIASEELIFRKRRRLENQMKDKENY